MAILKIARMGHPVLWRRAQEVEDPGAPEIRKLVADMIETLEDAEGVGLAAPQVYVPRRVIIFHVPAERLSEAEGPRAPEPQGIQILINPVVETGTGEMELGWEGCLSIPGMRGLVPRFATVGYRGLNLKGGTVERTASGFHARVVQHECDHLDGILYPMRMTDLSLLGFDEEFERHGLAVEAGEEAEPKAAREVAL